MRRGLTLLEIAAELAEGEGGAEATATEATITDPNLQAVLAGRGAAQFIQLYLDQATSPDLGKVFNEATMALFAGQSDPATVCQTISDAAATQ